MGASLQMLVLAKLVGWMLVHSLWQGALVGLLYHGCRAWVARGEARYRLGLTAMGALLLMQGATLVVLCQGGSPPTHGSLVAPLVGTFRAISSTEHLPAIFGWQGMQDAFLPWIAVVWSSGVLLLSLRALIQWCALRSLVMSARADQLWQRRLDCLAAPMGLFGRAKILCSDAVSSPLVIGVVRPVILLPVAVICRMPVAQVELILVHELAHVKRLDALANLFQIIIETLYFHHPLVRWISREVRSEREICCDRMALSRSPGQRRDYAEALAALGELRWRSSLVLASNGGLLLERVQLIASHRQDGEAGSAPAKLVALCLGLFLTMGMASHEWGLMSASTRWQIQPPRFLRAPIDRVLPPSDWRLTDLKPRRTAPAYPRNLPESWSLPEVPVADIANRRPIEELGGIQTPLRLAGSATLLTGTPNSDVLSHAAIAGPEPIRVQQPTYPQRALLAGIEGAVVIEFGIGRDGRVSDAHVVRSTPSGVFDQAALKALGAWQYAVPAGGAREYYRQTISFTLRAPSSGRTDLPGPQTRMLCKITTGSHICRLPEGASAARGLDH